MAFDADGNWVEDDPFTFNYEDFMPASDTFSFDLGPMFDLGGFQSWEDMWNTNPTAGGFTLQDALESGATAQDLLDLGFDTDAVNAAGMVGAADPGFWEGYSGATPDANTGLWNTVSGALGKFGGNLLGTNGTSQSLLQALTGSSNPSALGQLITGMAGIGGNLLATQAQTDAAKAAIDAQNAQFAQTQANLQPWLQAGAGAISRMQDPALANNLPSLALPNTPTLPGYKGVATPTLGGALATPTLGGAPSTPALSGASAGAPLQTNAGQSGIALDKFNWDPNAYFSNPAYQAMLRSGADAIDASAAAKGNFGSGNQAAELQRLGMTLGAQFQNQDYNQQMGTYGANQGAALNSLNATNAANLNNAQFGNQALQQLYLNDLNNTQFNNTTAQQGFQNALTGTQFNNTAAQQGFQNALTNTQFGNQVAQQDFTNRTSNNQIQYQNDLNTLMQQYNINANQALTLYNAMFNNANTAWNRQASLAGYGQTAGGQLGTFGGTVANNTSNALIGSGDATANMIGNIATNVGTMFR